MELELVAAFNALKAKYGGDYWSISPSFQTNPHPDVKYADETRYKELVAERTMFKDMSADPYLNSAGISSSWPHGRGVFCSDIDEKDGLRLVVWVGEEDHLRIMAMGVTSSLN